MIGFHICGVVFRGGRGGRGRFAFAHLVNHDFVMCVGGGAHGGHREFV